MFTIMAYERHSDTWLPLDSLGGWEEFTAQAVTLGEDLFSDLERARQIEPEWKLRIYDETRGVFIDEAKEKEALGV